MMPQIEYIYSAQVAVHQVAMWHQQDEQVAQVAVVAHLLSYQIQA
jgi:hypothetical protein